MFYDIKILGFSLYEICFALGTLAGLTIFQLYMRKKKIPKKYFNFFLIAAALSFIVGSLTGMAVQSLYDYLKSGEFKQSGITFMGALSGGAIAFAISVLIFRAAVKEKEMSIHTMTAINAGVCGLTLGHSIGRIGCLFSGCCYGICTDGFLGVTSPYTNCKVLPVQLFEAVFLLLLFFLLSALYFKRSRYVLPVYLFSYGTFRFIIEFFRGDDRGVSLIRGLTPSQPLCIIFAISGIILFFIIWAKKSQKTEKKID